MRPIDLVITGAPRSGFKYVTLLLFSLGCPMTHERLFGARRQIYTKDTTEMFGEASWLSVPFLNQLPESTIIWHQTRNRAQVLNSLYSRPYMILSGDPPQSPFQRFVRNHFPLFNEEESDKDRLLHFYEYWTEQAEQYSSFTYDVTALHDEAFVQELVERSFHKLLPLPLIRAKIDRLPTTVNGGKPKQEIF